MTDKYNLSYIFDWNKRDEHLSIYRITRDYPRSDAKPGEPTGCIKCGYIDVLEDLRMSDREWLCSLKTGRYHFKGNFWSHQDYYGEYDWGIDLVSCIRIR